MNTRWLAPFMSLCFLAASATATAHSNSNSSSQQPTEAEKDTTYFFYRPYDYGSMAMFTPWNVVLNGSYDVLQLDGRNREITTLPYGTGFANVWENTVLHPGATISQICM